MQARIMNYIQLTNGLNITKETESKFIYFGCFRQSKSNTGGPMAPVHESICFISFARGVISTRKTILDHVTQCALDIFRFIRFQLHIHQHVHNPGYPMSCSPVFLPMPFVHQGAASLPQPSTGPYDFINNSPLYEFKFE